MLYDLCAVRGLVVRRLLSGWGFPRLLRWLDADFPFHGRVLIWNFLLSCVFDSGVVFSVRCVRDNCKRYLGSEACFVGDLYA